VIYDLIVCGAGPAGSSAAAAAARAGMKVALLEKQRFPRHKPCGGGVPRVLGTALRDLVPEAVIECDVRHMRHTYRFGDPCSAPINPPGAEPELSLWMVQRTVFDTALARRAAEAGADLREAAAVRSVEVGSDGVTVRAGDRAGEVVIQGRHLLGADGAAGITAKAAKLRPERALAVAIEAEVPHRWGDGHEELRPDVVHLEYGAVHGGYAWVFPKADHLNVGAGVFWPRRADRQNQGALRGELERAIFSYLDMLEVPFDRERVRFSAHPVPVWTGRHPLQTRDGRILLAGDAASLINPLFGDGILHAVRSGLIAAECLAEEDPLGYTRRLHAELAGNFDSARELARFFYSCIGLAYTQVIKRPLATRAAARLLCGQTLFESVAGSLMGRLRASVADLYLPAADADR
jgi:geranylgeranyl reductase family protein